MGKVFTEVGLVHRDTKHTKDNTFQIAEVVTCIYDGVRTK